MASLVSVGDGYLTGMQLIGCAGLTGQAAEVICPSVSLEADYNRVPLDLLFMWVLGLTLRFSCFHDKHFTERTTSPAPPNQRKLQNT